MRVPANVLPSCLALVLLAVLGGPGAASAKEAEALMKRSGCFKCHSVAQQKLAPSYRDVAAKYRGNPDAGQRLYIHLTTNPRISVDGQEEEHVSLGRATEADVRSVVEWVLSR